MQWMAPKAPLQQLLASWGTDAPLLPAEGAGSSVVDETRFRAFTEHFHAGARLNGITTLREIAPKLSNPVLRFPEEQLFRLGCRLFTDASSVLVKSMPKSETDVSEFGTQVSPVFPLVWPENYTLPVYITDRAAFPERFYLLANEEVYLAFCLILHHCLQQ